MAATNKQENEITKMKQTESLGFAETGERKKHMSSTICILWENGSIGKKPTLGA